MNRKFLMCLALSAVLAAPAVAQNIAPQPVNSPMVKTIYVDNRGFCGDSRIGQGQRVQARMTVSRLRKQYEAQGFKVKVLRIEAGGDDPRGFYATDISAPVIQQGC